VKRLAIKRAAAAKPPRAAASGATIVVIACGVAAASPAEWHIDAPAGWTASEQPADELARAMPGATSATAIEIGRAHV